VTSWKDQNAWSIPSYKSGKWDGYHRLFRRDAMTFPTGLLFVVRRVLKHNRVKVELDDRREFPDHGDKVAELAGITLRPDQIEAVQACVKYKRGIVKAPPGCGKTESMIAVAATLNLYPVLWLTHQISLLHQTAERFHARLPAVKVGMLSGDADFIGDVTVATVQTLNAWAKNDPEKAKAFLNTVQVLMADEAHHGPARTWYKIFNACPAPFRFGCSATPLDRTDQNDLKLVGSTDRIIYELTPAEAAELGILVRPELFMVEYPDPPVDKATAHLMDWGKPWVKIYERHIVKSKERNDAVMAVAKDALEQNRRVLIIVRQLKHGVIFRERLEEYFQSSMQVAYLQGSDPMVKRKEVIDKFKKGVVRVIIGTTIFDEGVDIPEIDTVIIASGGKAKIKAIQRAGRGMRGNNSEHTLQVFDFWDTSTPTFKTHTRQRRRAYESLDVGEVQRVKAEDFEPNLFTGGGSDG
jgi:superfamily II DNA or RNA helicase